MVNCSEKRQCAHASLLPATTRQGYHPEKPVRLVHHLSLLLLFMVTAGCTTVESSQHEAVPARHVAASNPAETVIGETPVLDLNTDTTVEKLIPVLAEKRVVFVGERHNRYDHHLMQLEIIRRLHQTHPKLAIGMEAFQQPFQRHLDDYVAGTISEQEMLRATEYYRRWRMDYRLYAPILRYAREQQLPVVALNLPVELTRKIGRTGLDGLSEAERARIPAGIDRSDAAYEARIREVFEYHPNDSAQAFEHFLEVQLAWDEGMAERAAGFLQANPDHHMIILAGNGHLAYGSAIPRRLLRRLETSMAIVINSWEGSIEPGLADYLLLPAEQALPPAGKIGALLEEENDALRVTTCLDDSPCIAAGIKTGDRILSINDESINSMAALHLALWDRQPGDVISIGILRQHWFSADKNLTFEITLQ